MPINQDILDKKASELKDSELFERIVYKIRQKYGFQISEAEAHAAARNLIGYTQTLLELSANSGKVKS